MSLETVWIEVGDGEYMSPPGRLMYPALFTPSKKAKGSEDTSYQATLLFEPDCDHSLIEEVIEKELNNTFSKKRRSEVQKKLKFFFKKTEDASAALTGYADDFPYMVKAASGSNLGMPGVCDKRGRDLDPEEDEEEVYSGRQARIIVKPQGYDQQGGVGVTAYLQSTQLLAKTDPMGNARRKASAMFQPVDIEEDDEDDEVVDPRG